MNGGIRQVIIPLRDAASDIKTRQQDRRRRTKATEAFNMIPSQSLWRLICGFLKGLINMSLPTSEAVFKSV